PTVPGSPACVWTARAWAAEFTASFSTSLGNTMNAGRDDNGGGVFSPDYAMVLRDCAQTVITGNTMLEAGRKELICDLGGHGEGFIQKDNVGTLRPET